MNTPTKEEFYAAVHCLAGYAAPHEKSLLADYDGTLGIRDASVEILKKAFAALEAAEADSSALDAWRVSALAVEKEWDAQEVGKLLGLKPGASIRAGIAPAVKELQAQNELLYATLEAVSKSDWWTGGMGVYDSKTKARLNKQIETALAARKEDRT